MSTKYVISDAANMPYAIMADRMTKKMQPGQKKVVSLTQANVTYKFIVEQGMGWRRVIEIAQFVPYDLCFTPVAALYEDPAATPDPITEDYRTGLRKKDPVLPDFRRAGDPLVMHSVFPGGVGSDNPTPDIVYTKFRDGHAGTSSWYGDSPNVISWNGCGAMDAAQNNYSAINRQYNPPRWTNPPFELQYYTGLEWGASPDSSNHLMGDRAIANATVNPPLEGKVYRNGKEVASMKWQVISACERQVYVLKTNSYVWRLRVLCAPWLTPTEYNPISGDTDFSFSAATLMNFYLYDEDPDEPSGWKLNILPIPAIDEQHSNESYIAQTPIFAPDGQTAVGIIETAFFVGNNANKKYINSKWRNHSQAWVLKIAANTAQPSCVLVEPAAYIRTQQDNPDAAARTFEQVDTVQILSIASLEPRKALTRTDRVTSVKNQGNVITLTQGLKTYPFFGPDATATQAGQYFWDWCVAHAGDYAAACIEAWYASRPNEPLPPQPAYVSFTIDGNSNNYYSPTYTWKPYLGSSGTSNWSGLRLEVYSATVSFNNANENLTTVAERLYEYVLPQTYSPVSQVTTVTTTSEFDAFGTPICGTSKVDTLTSAGYKLGAEGPGLIYEGQGAAFTPMDLGYIVALVGLSYSGGVALIPATNVYGADPDVHRAVAVDARKNAVITKNVTQGTFTYSGIPPGPL